MLVRSEEKAKIIRKEYNIEVVVASLSDLDVLEGLASRAHYFIHTVCRISAPFFVGGRSYLVGLLVFLIQADSDDLPACEAILRGLKLYNERTGKVPTLIHTVCLFSSIFLFRVLILN